MARFYPDILFSDLYGSAGEVTARHVRGKTFLLKRSTAAFPGTAAQLERQEIHRRAMAAWRELPHEVQLVWHGYAKEVEPHRPPFDHTSWISGQNLFVSAYHGFHTLGDEHVPFPVPFEPFPGFALELASAEEAGDDLAVGVSVAGLEHTDAGRYRLYGRMQLVEAGHGMTSRVAWRSILASESCHVSPSELVLPSWRSVWPSVATATSMTMNGSFVLLDTVTGYRSRKHPQSFIVEL